MLLKIRGTRDTRGLGSIKNHRTKTYTKKKNNKLFGFDVGSLYHDSPVRLPASPRNIIISIIISLIINHKLRLQRTVRWWMNECDCLVVTSYRTTCVFIAICAYTVVYCRSKFYYHKTLKTKKKNRNEQYRDTVLLKK